MLGVEVDPPSVNNTKVGLPFKTAGPTRVITQVRSRGVESRVLGSIEIPQHKMGRSVFKVNRDQTREEFLFLLAIHWCVHVVNLEWQTINHHAHDKIAPIDCETGDFSR